MSRSYADLVRLIVGEIMRLNPQVGETINRDTLATTLEEDSDSRRFRMAFHEARDELVEMSPSMMFKVKHGNKGTYVRIAEQERAELGGARYLRKARKAALRGVRRVARTDTTQLNSDEKRLHEHRMIQGANAWTGINDAIKKRQQPRWPSEKETQPQPLPRFSQPRDVKKPTPGARWITEGPPEGTQ